MGSWMENASLSAGIDKENTGRNITLMGSGEAYDQTIPQCKDISPYELRQDGWRPKHIAYVDPFIYPYLCIYMTYIFLISVSGNVTVILAFIKTKSLRTPLNYAIISLSVADVGCGGMGGFLSILANGARHFFMGKTMCQVEGYILSFVGCAGLNTIVVMAIERYIVVCKPALKPYITRKTALCGIAMAWAYAFIWNTPPLILWDGYTVEGIGTSCAPNWYVTEPGPRAFIVAYFFGGFLIPYFTILYCYGTLIWTLRQVSKESTLSGSKNPEKEVTRMILVMVAAFSFAWLPYSAVAMYNAINYQNQLPPIWSAPPVFFAKTAACYNPLVYIGMNRQFREAVFRMIFGFNPWSDEITTSAINSQGSVVTTISSRKVGTA